MICDWSCIELCCLALRENESVFFFFSLSIIIAICLSSPIKTLQWLRRPYSTMILSKCIPTWTFNVLKRKPKIRTEFGCRCLRKLLILLSEVPTENVKTLTNFLSWNDRSLKHYCLQPSSRNIWRWFLSRLCLSIWAIVLAYAWRVVECVFFFLSKKWFPALSGILSGSFGSSI